MNVGMITLNQSIKTEQNYVTWILTAFLFILKLKILNKDIANDVQEWFDTYNYSKDDKRPLPIGKNKKKISFLKDKLVGKIMKKFVALRAKTYAYLMDDDNEHKKAKGTTKSVIKRGHMLENYKDYLLNDKIILQSKQRFKSDHHNVYTEQINKIALSTNNDKRLQILDKITTYSYGLNAFKSMRK